MKKIALFVIIISIIGIATLILAYCMPNLYVKYDSYNLFNVFNLGFTTNGKLADNTILNFSFTLLFLFSGWLYYSSNGKEVRLLRFLFSIILISKIIGFINFFVFLGIQWGFWESIYGAYILPKTGIMGAVGEYLTILLQRISGAVWIYLSLRILKYLNKEMSLEVQTTEYNGVVSAYFVNASKMQRLFHLVIDNIVTVLVFCNLFLMLLWIKSFQHLLGLLAREIGGNSTLMIAFAFFRLLYYVFFEVLFHASPAKFLTETRVVKDDDSPLDLKTSLIRTISRSIPFNAVSFLFAFKGWQDKCSDTSVVKENNRGL